MKKFIILMLLFFISIGKISFSAQNDDYFCLVEQGKIKAEIIYTSDKIIGIIDPNNPNEALFFTRHHFNDLYDIHIFSARTLCELIIVIDETVSKKLGWRNGFIIESKQGLFSPYHHLYIRAYKPNILEKLKYILQ